MQATTYVLGNSEAEHHRLVQQARYLAPATEDMLISAGICEGMSVLDVGCGAGDVALMAGALVGRSGMVTGIDRDSDVLRFAAMRASERSADNVRFVETRIEEALNRFGERAFDAVIGRFVLVHQPDPAETLRSVLPMLAGGGIVAFLEPELGRVAQSHPEIALVEQIAEWVQETLFRAGVRMNMGTTLAGTMSSAGLARPQTKLSILAGGGEDYFGYGYWADTTRSLLPIMEALGVATRADVDIDTLEQRLRDAVVAARGSMVTQVVASAWCSA